MGALSNTTLLMGDNSSYLPVLPCLGVTHSRSCSHLTPSGWTELHYAAAHGDEKPETLSRAAGAGKVEAVSALLARHAKTDVKAKSGKTARDRASTDEIRVLLDGRPC